MTVILLYSIKNKDSCLRGSYTALGTYRTHNMSHPSPSGPSQYRSIVNNDICTLMEFSHVVSAGHVTQTKLNTKNVSTSFIHGLQG